MTSLVHKLSDMVGAAFVASGFPRELGRVMVSDRPDLAQFQCNGAMAAAKTAKKNPREVAQAVVERLLKNPVFSKIEIAGPGFINLNVTDAYLGEHLQSVSGNARCGVPTTGDGRTIILDYGGMNVAKAMHVGHLRPTVIGDALKHIVQFSGYRAQGDIHMGDWGLPMGQIISELEIRYPEWPYFKADCMGPYPSDAPFSYELLEQIYPEASNACKTDPARLEKARKATAELQDGRPGYRALWNHFMTLSMADIRRNIEPLGVQFEIWKGESDVNDLIVGLALDLKKAGIAVESDGALVIPVAEEGDNKEMPPLMFYKSDGAVTYGTTDLATIYDRVKAHYDLAGLIYVTDKRQNLHFEQVFRAAKKADYVEGITLAHVGFGTLNGPDGKPFKTRDGGVMRFDMLLSMAMEKARERLKEADLAQDMPAAEKEDTARKVAVAAIKFADLSNQTHVDYKFDLDQMTRFEGRTGPYLLYQAVRIKSLLKKAADQGDRPAAQFSIREEDRALALVLTQLPEAFNAALLHNAPYHLCDYTYRLAQQFSAFYASCHILSEQDKNLRAGRLALCMQTYAQMELVLSLLGISIPERM